MAAASAAVAKAEAELQLAEARAAAARAKAELEEAKLRVDSGMPAVLEPTGPAPVVVDMGVQPEKPLVEPFSGEEARPAKLILSPEGSAVIKVLLSLEAVVVMGNRTVLDGVLRASFAALWQFVQAGRAARNGELLEDMPQDVRADVDAVGAAVSPDMLASALSPRITSDGVRQGGDWRPLALAISRIPQMPEILERAVDWPRVFPDAVERTSGTSREEAKRAIVGFFRSPALREFGEWTDAELDAAERLVQRDERLRRVFGRLEAVREEVAESFKSAGVVIPIALVIVLLLAAFCVCSLLGNGPVGGVDTTAVTDGVQDLPLLKLEK